MYTTVAESAFRCANCFLGCARICAKCYSYSTAENGKAHVRPDFKQPSQPTASFVLVKLFGAIFIK